MVATHTIFPSNKHQHLKCVVSSMKFIIAKNNLKYASKKWWLKSQEVKAIGQKIKAQNSCWGQVGVEEEVEVP